MKKEESAEAGFTPSDDYLDGKIAALTTVIVCIITEFHRTDESRVRELLQKISSTRKSTDPKVWESRTFFNAAFNEKIDEVLLSWRESGLL